MMPLEGLQGQPLNDFQLRLLKRYLPVRPNYTSDYWNDVEAMKSLRKKLAARYAFDENAEKQFSKLRMAGFWTHYPLEETRKTSQIDGRRPINLHPDTISYVIKILKKGYSKVDRSEIKYLVPQATNLGFPFMLSGIFQLAVRMINLLYGILAKDNEGVDMLLKLHEYWALTTRMVKVMLMAGRLQDTGSSKTTPLYKNGAVFIENDTFLEKRHRAINLASKVEYAIGYIPTKIIQKSAYKSVLSGNDPVLSKKYITGRIKRKLPVRWTDFSYYDNCMAGEFGKIINKVKVLFLTDIGDTENAERMEKYLKLNSEYEYVYPYDNTFVTISQESIFSSGRADTALHGTLGHMIMFVDAVLNYNPTWAKELLNDEKSDICSLECFGDDGAQGVGLNEQDADEFLKFFISHNQSVFQMKTEEETPGKYLGVNYDVKSIFYSKLDAYALIRKTYSPERYKEPALIDISLVSRWMMFQDIFGAKEGTDITLDIIDQLSNKTGILRMDKVGVVKPTYIKTDLAEQIKSNKAPIDVLVEYSRRISTTNTNVLGDSVYGLMNIGIDTDEFFEDIFHNNETLEQATERLKDTIDEAVVQFQKGMASEIFLCNFNDVKRKLQNLLSGKLNRSQERNLAYEILYDLTPIFK